MSDSMHALERLVAICEDGVLGYREAATKVRDEETRHALAAAASRREEVESVLRVALGELGQKVGHSSSVAGHLHRAWIDAVTALRGASTGAVLNECMRGERATIHAFSNVLGKPLAPGLRTCVEEQLQRVLRAAAELVCLQREAAKGDRREEAR